MATVEQKKLELAKLLKSWELAESVFQEAAQVETKALEMKLKYKERRSAAGPFADVPDYLPPARSGIGSILNG